MEDPRIINRKLDENLHTCIISYQFPTTSHRLFLHRWAYSQNMMKIFVESTISRKSYPKGRWVNNNRPGGAGNTKFQEVLDLIFKAGRNCVVFGRDINDAFREINPTKRRVSFCLSAAPFIFNPFSKGLLIIRSRVANFIRRWLWISRCCACAL